MEDINNALLHIKAKHNGEIPYQYGSRECAKLMDSYAKEYHDLQLKKFSNELRQLYISGTQHNANQGKRTPAKQLADKEMS